MLTLRQEELPPVGGKWRIHTANIRVDGGVVLVLIRSGASVAIRIDPRSLGGNALVRTPRGDVSYSSASGLTDAEAAELTRRVATELGKGSFDRISAAWPHLALPPVDVPPTARQLRSNELADWLGLHAGGQLDAWRLENIRDRSRGVGVVLTVEHVTIDERARVAIAAPGEEEQAFTMIGPWAVLPLPDVPNAVPSPATLRLCSGLATLVADRMAADPVVPRIRPAADPPSAQIANVLRHRGLEIADVRRGPTELRVIVRGPMGETTLTVTRRRGRINSFRNGKYLAVVPSAGSLQQASWIAKACDELLEDETALLEALGTSGNEENQTGRLVAAATNPGPGFVVSRERTGVLPLTSPCLADCAFCGQETTRAFTLEPVDDVLADLRRNAPLYERVLIVGFEPLTHPGVVSMIRTCRDAGVEEVELMTSGVALATAGDVRALVDAGLTHVAVPIYAPEAATNDLIMRRSGAFDLTVEALDFLAAAGVEIFVHSLLLAGVLDGVDRLMGLARERWGARFVAAAPRSKSSYQEIAPRYADVDAAVREAPVVGMPLCLVPRMLDHPDLESGRPLQLTLGALAECVRSYFMQGLTHPEVCNGCAARTACTGVMPEQLLVEPGLALVPVTSLSSPRENRLDK